MDQCLQLDQDKNLEQPAPQYATSIRLADGATRSSVFKKAKVHIPLKLILVTFKTKKYQ